MFELDFPKLSPASAYSVAPKDAIDMSEIYINNFNKKYFREHGKRAQTVSNTLEFLSRPNSDTLCHSSPNSGTVSNQTGISEGTTIAKYQANSIYKRSGFRTASTPETHTQITRNQNNLITNTNRMVHSDGYLPHMPQNQSHILETLRQDKSFTKLGKYRQDITPTKLELDVRSMQGSLSVAGSSTMNGSTN
jgi:hypothetical protein